MNPTKLQFGIGTLLFGVLLAAGYLAGYNFGGNTRDAKVRNETISVVNYDVSEFLDSNAKQSVDAQLKNLRSLIVQTVDPDSWQRTEFDIEYYSANQSLVVRQSGSCHAVISDLIDQLREMRKST